VLSEALRLLARLRVRSSVTSSAVLGLEFGIPPICAVVAAARTRALKKFPQLKTVIADLIASPPRTREHTWVTGTIWWLRRFCRPASLVDIPGDAADIVKASVWERYNAVGKPKTWRFYVDSGFTETRKYLVIATHNPSISRGIYWLCRLRVGAIWFADRLAAIGYIDREYRNKCPFCNEVGVETAEHLLLVCNRWRQVREDYLGEFVAQHNPTWVQLLGGSNLQGGVEGVGNMGSEIRWFPNNPGRIEADLQLPHHGDENGESLPTSVLVAQYLQKVMPIRFGLLHNLIEGPRANANAGMAVLIDPEEVLPNGADAEPDGGNNNEGNIDNRGGIVATFAH